MFHALDALLCDYCVYRPVRQPNFVKKCTTPCTTPAIFHATSTSVVTIHVAEFLLPTILSVLNTLDALPCVYCVFGPLRQPNFVQNCLHKCTTPALFQANSSPIGTISTAGSMIPTILSVLNTLDALLRDYRVYRPVRQPNFVPLLFHLNPTSVGRRAGSCCP